MTKAVPTSEAGDKVIYLSPHTQRVSVVTVKRVTGLHYRVDDEKNGPLIHQSDCIPYNEKLYLNMQAVVGVFFEAVALERAAKSAIFTQWLITKHEAAVDSA